MLREQQPGSLSASNSSLPSQCQQIFKQCNISATRVSELVSGVKLAAVVNKLLYDDSNSILSNQIITQNEERKGNNVINMNMVLKQVKSNNKYKCPDHISELTTFKLIDNDQEMIGFVKWLAECWKKSSSRDHQKKNNKNALQDLQIQGSKQNLQINTQNYDDYENQGYVIRNRREANNREALKLHKIQHVGSNDQNEELQPLDDEYNAGEQNIFENVYFCDRDLSPQKTDPQLNDSLEMSEKVSKKGSFKVVRPRTMFEDNNKKEPAQQSNYKRMEDVESPEKHQPKNRNKVVGTQAQDRYYSDEKESSARKTIPKMAERPPLYKKAIKDQTKSQTRTNEQQEQIKIPSPFNFENSHHSLKKETTKKQKQSSNLAKNHGQLSEQRDLKSSELFKQISRIEEQIKKSSLENSQQLKGHSRVRSNAFNTESRTKSSRKIFKVEIKEVNQNQRKSIIQWLISINLLNSMATTYYDQFHEICKNGVIFPEIINHHLGRTGTISYVKNPVKSAEIHSNYQKVFNCLKDMPNFESQLFFMYEFFVPQVVENAFWSLLRSCQQCFQKTILKNSKLYTRDSEIRSKLSFKASSQANSRVKTQKNESKPKSIKKNFDFDGKQYEKIKYGSSNFKSNTNKTVEFKNETPKVSSVEKQSKSKRKASLDFIKQLPEKANNFKHEELVQAEQPIEINKGNKGYKQLHELKKSHNTSSFIKTPEKKLDNSMARSRINSTNSVKKIPQKPQSPSITLEMEMKALKYLKEKSYLNNNSLEPVPLFEDPIRNGVLLNKIIHDEVKISYKYHQKPKNIIDCKQNFTKGFTQLKQAFWPVPSNYEFYFENIIKGQMTLFYGLIWHVLSMMNKGPVGIGALKNESAIMSISKNYNNPEIQLTQKTAQEIIFWVREIEQDNPQIADLQLRDFNQISVAIVGKNLLYKIATAIMPQKYTLKPTYETPINQMEQQSNIKKILSFLAHNKILRSQLAWKAKSLVKKEKNTTVQILKQLMAYHKNVKKPILNLHPQNPIISFVKFARNNSREDIKNPDRVNEKLQTTMANNSYPTIPVKKQQAQKKYDSMPVIEVPWMRNLGFTGDLALNNGVILCRLICKLTMRTLTFNQNPTSKAQCLTNIRKALKLIDKFKWDEQDIACADEKMTMEIYKFIKQKYKHSYALKELN